MKSVAAAALMIAVSAWGQSKPATSKAGAIAPCHFRAEGCSDQPRCPTGTSYPPGSYMDCYNQPKPPAKKFNVAPCLHGDIKVSGPVKLINCLPPKPHKLKPSVKESVKPHPGDPNLATVTTCISDGLACIGPVEMLPKNKKCWPSSDGVNETCDIGGGMTTSTLVIVLNQDILERLQKVAPDKAAVPVERVSVSAQILARDGTLAVMLSDSEYSHLQQLRAAVVEEEKRLAVKYGAKMASGCNWKGNGFTTCDGIYDLGDHYEFHKQFLLISKEGR